MGVGSSFIWQGIVTARIEAMQGYRWVVGDGETVKYCQDLWLQVLLSYFYQRTFELIKLEGTLIEI